MRRTPEYYAEQVEEYNQNWGADFSIASPKCDQLLKTFLVDYEKLYSAFLDHSYAELDAKSTLTIEDEFSVKQLRDDFDNYCTYCHHYLGIQPTAKTTKEDVATIERRLEAAYGDHAIEMIKDMPAKPKTPNQVILVRRTRWAFNHLIPEEKMRIVGTPYYQRLIDAEKIKKKTMITGVKSTTIKLSATATSEGIQLYCDKSLGYKMNYYKVYRSTSKKGPYKYLYSVNYPVSLNFSVKSGQTYYYKVIGVKQMFGKHYETKTSNIAHCTAK